jgi:hypothetical protein
MKRLIQYWLGAGAIAALVAGAGAACLAQSQNSGAQSSGAQPQHTIQMVQTQALLDTSIDAKKAKQGQEVRAKLEENVSIPDSQTLPKNTVLEGHVDQVTPSEHKSDSTVVVTFDKAKLKSGQELPIKATVIAVSEPSLQAPQTGGGMPVGGAAPSGGAAMPSGGGSSAGGMRGGGGGEPSAPSTPQQPMSAPNTTGSQQQTQGNGVPDVTLTSNIHQSSSATFSSKGRNVHVPDGTQMELAIAVIPAGVHLQ